MHGSLAGGEILTLGGQSKTENCVLRTGELLSRSVARLCLIGLAAPNTTRRDHAVC